MNQPTDDNTLETYLNGDTQVSRRYRELDAHEVPPDLDRRILAEAHAAAEKQTKSRAWMRWSAPLALAASAVLVLSIVIETGIDRDATLTSAPRAPAAVDSVRERAEEAVSSGAELLVEVDVSPPAVSAPSATPSVQAEEAQPASKSIEQVTAPPSRLRARQESQQSVPAASAERPSSIEPSPADPPMTFSAGEPSAPPPVAAEARVARESERASVRSVDINEIAVTGSNASRREQRAAGPRDTIRADRADDSPRKERAIGGAAVRDEARDPEHWLEEIRELRRAGKVEEAERQWREFREMFPEYEVAEGDLARGEEQ